MSSGSDYISRLHDEIRKLVTVETKGLLKDVQTLRGHIATDLDRIDTKLQALTKLDTYTIRSFLKKALEEVSRGNENKIGSLALFAHNIRKKDTQEDILSMLLDEAHMCAPRAVLFVLQEEQFVAWSSRGYSDTVVQKLKECTFATQESALLQSALGADALLTISNTSREKKLLEFIPGAGPWHAFPLKALLRPVAVLLTAASNDSCCNLESLCVLMDFTGLCIENLALRLLEEMKSPTSGAEDWRVGSQEVSKAEAEEVLTVEQEVKAQLPLGTSESSEEVPIPAIAESEPFSEMLIITPMTPSFEGAPKDTTHPSEQLNRSLELHAPVSQILFTPLPLIQDQPLSAPPSVDETPWELLVKEPLFKPEIEETKAPHTAEIEAAAEEAVIPPSIAHAEVIEDQSQAAPPLVEETPLAMPEIETTEAPLSVEAEAVVEEPRVSQPITPTDVIEDQLHVTPPVDETPWALLVQEPLAKPEVETPEESVKVEAEAVVTEPRISQVEAIVSPEIVPEAQPKVAVQMTPEAPVSEATPNDMVVSPQQPQASAMELLLQDVRKALEQASPELESLQKAQPPAAPPRIPPTEVGSPKEVARSPEEEKLHSDAKRFARLLVSEIKLYNEQRVAEGRRNRDLYNRLRKDIDKSREMYIKRVSPLVFSKIDYFHMEVVRILGDNDSTTLGNDYPGSRSES